MKMELVKQKAKLKFDGFYHANYFCLRSGFHVHRNIKKKLTDIVKTPLCRFCRLNPSVRSICFNMCTCQQCKYVSLYLRPYDAFNFLNQGFE